jgi:putative transposase
VLPIAPSTDHVHVPKRADPEKLSARAKRDLALKPEIERVFAENFEVYSVREVWRQMVREGFGVSRCTVERLMSDLGLYGVIRGKPLRTVVQDKAAPCPRDNVNLVFHAPRRKGSGCRTSPTSAPCPASFMWPSSSMPLPVGSSGGG